MEVYTLLAHRLAFAEAAALTLLQLFTLALAALLYLRLPTYPLPPGGPEPVGRPWALTLGLSAFFLLLYAPLLVLFLEVDPGALPRAWASEDFTPLPVALGNSLRFAFLAFLLALPLGWPTPGRPGSGGAWTFWGFSPSW